MASPGTTWRIFQTIDLVLAHTDGVTFSFLQSELNVPKSSMHSILKELCQQNILYFNERMKTYTAGSHFIQLSARCMAQVNIVREINTVASELARLTKTTVSASVLRDRHIIYVVEHLERAGSRQSNVGLSFPAHTTAMGKMLLSSLPDDEVRELYRDNHFELYSEKTISSTPALLEAMHTIRRCGYAIDYGEFAPSIACLAMPICVNGNTIAAMSISTNIGHFTEQYVQNSLRALKDAAEEVARRLGDSSC